MKYILIDNFAGNLNIICNEDDSSPLLIDSLDKAKELLPEYCQNGQIIPFNTDIIYIIEEMYTAIKNNKPIVHIGDLIAGILNKNITFLPSGEIIEE